MECFTIAEFCELHGAFVEGHDVAKDDRLLSIDVWKSLPPEWVVWIATRKGVLSNRQLRSFILFCCENVAGLMYDERSKKAVLVARGFLDGELCEGSLAEAEEHAWAVVREVSNSAEKTASISDWQRKWAAWTAKWAVASEASASSAAWAACICAHEAVRPTDESFMAKSSSWLCNNCDPVFAKIIAG